MANVDDPVRHFAFDVHRYFDQDSSGTHPDAVSGLIGAERIAAFQDWARQHGFTAVLGEFNGGRNPAALNALADICAEMEANADVWRGWAAWAGGPRWPEDEMFNLEPWKDGRIRPQTEILARFARGDPNAWICAGAVLDADFARVRLHGADSLAGVIAGAAAEPDAHPLVARAGGLVAGPTLLALMQRPGFSLLAETRELAPASAPLDLMIGDGAPRLRLQRDGSLVIDGRPALQTGAQPIGHWRMRRRLGVSLDRSAGRLAIAATGARGAEQTAGAAVEELACRTVAFLPAGGALARLTLFDRCLGLQELEDQVA
jgi:Cellulase (glycosyl hydrolase family 5)